MSDPHNSDDGDLEVSDPSSTVAGNVQEAAPVQIGPYRLLEKLGEGGMGEVWLAEQTEPVRRKVAFKVIKQGMDTRQVVARFETERQALALMDHPAIAKVFDAGATPLGRPYFVMEYVQGVPITEYCDRHRLPNRERLELFKQVCAGVQHAHQKAVIHRDLTPANVLVAFRDGRPVPKIIDFGVAKATAQKLTTKTMHTQVGMLIGTPSYMSPEQAELTGEDIDTRTDVYTLGVMLYELLVGALPFERKELQRAGLEAMVRKIREEEPPRPSVRLSTLGEQSTESAKRRRTDLPALRRELSGDLDWITLKVLEKDRTRRYGSPQELAADIERYLTDEPVLARPPSTAYRARKFIKRHAWGVGTAVAGVVLLIAFAGTMALQAQRIAAERDRANREAEAKGQVAEFLQDLFTVSDPGEARGNTITARELLDKGAAKIEDTLTGQPRIRADLMATMGVVYQNLGLYAQAEPLLEQALAERTRTLGDDHPETLESMNDMANLYVDQGRYAEAEPLHLAALEARKRMLGDDHADTLGSMNNLANLYWSQGRYAEAEPLYLAALETRKHVLGEDHPDTLSSMNNLADLYRAQGRYAEAEPLFLATLETRKRVLGDHHPETLTSMNNLAVLYAHQGRYAEVEPLYLAALEIKKRVLGDDHPETLASVNNLANLYVNQGRYAEAEQLYLGALETSKRVLGNDHPRTLMSMSNLATLYLRQDRYAEAEPLYLATLETSKRVLGDDHPYTLTWVYNLACLEARRGDKGQAMSWLRRSVEAGFARPDLMAKDTDLEPLHGPEFDALVELARQNAADQRAK